jgi:hypothetical protein
MSSDQLTMRMAFNGLVGSVSPPRPPEALTLSTRCGFRLHEAGAHLAYARLHLAETPPAPPAARHHLGLARAIIHTTGYHRRDPDLAELDRALALSPAP